jgi:hypothetical protein
MIRTFFASLIIILISSQIANAIPVFSRKYQTSCVTCHNPFPRLNAFGEAFRYNGYQFPTDDEDQIKEKPLKLGADAYKRVWPKAVWPSSIPANAPIALRGRTGFIVDSEGENIYNEFGKPALQLIAAGSMTENISLFVGAHLFEDGTAGSIDRFFIRFNNLLPKLVGEKVVQLRVGQFIPDIVPFATNHRGLTKTAFAFNTYGPSLGSDFIAGHAHGLGPFGIENFQIGVELSGIIKSRWRYVAGAVNGSGTETDLNSLKDFYGRISYKIGGLGFDGQYRTNNINTDKEKSLIIGIFGYSGYGTESSSDYSFTRAGLDIKLTLNKFNLLGGYIMGEDGNMTAGKYDLFFIEPSYNFYPWLTGLVRYEQAKPEGKESAKQLVSHLSALIVANIKVKLESRLNLDDPNFNNLYFGLDFAF